MGYLAAYAGAELRAPAVRPEDGSLPQSVRPPDLQLLQPAGQRCGFDGAGFTFAWITPVYCVLEYKEHGEKLLFIGESDPEQLCGQRRPLSGKVSMGTTRRWSDESHWFTVSCILKSGQSCPKSRTSEVSWVISFLITSRLLAGAVYRAVLYRLMTQQYHLVAQFGTASITDLKILIKEDLRENCLHSLTL